MYIWAASGQPDVLGTTLKWQIARMPPLQTPILQHFLHYVPRQSSNMKFSEWKWLSLKFLELEFVNYYPSGMFILRGFFLVFGIRIPFDIRKLHKVIVTLLGSLVFYSKPCKIFVFFGAFSDLSCRSCSSGSRLNWRWESLEMLPRRGDGQLPAPGRPVQEGRVGLRNPHAFMSPG